MKLLLVTLFVLALLAIPVALLARGRFIEDGPGRLADIRSLGDAIRTARAAHIVFVHGMRAEKRGGSAAFRAALVRRLGGSDDQSPEHFIINLDEDLDDEWPRDATVAGVPIWRTREDWVASRPFVSRYRLTLGGGQRVIVDEVNWWPLLFPLKCRFLLLPEHHLSGGDAAHLALCRNPDWPYHQWITDEEYRAALARPPAGRGAWINRSIKREILNWGLSDAVIALGPMRTFVNGTMQRAFALAEEEAMTAQATRRVIIAESLGSFAVLDSAGSGPVSAYLDQTHDLYFFANQFALLELARIEGLGRTDGVRGLVQAPAETPPSPLARLAQWARTGQRLQAVSAEDWRPRQVIALNDPNDLLTYYVPPLPGATIVNVLVRNARSWLGLFADPARAHTGHAANQQVWDVLLAPGAGRDQSVEPVRMRR
jgi:hypothetical protein